MAARDTRWCSGASLQGIPRQLHTALNVPGGELLHRLLPGRFARQRLSSGADASAFLRAFRMQRVAPQWPSHVTLFVSHARSSEMTTYVQRMTPLLAAPWQWL